MSVVLFPFAEYWWAYVAFSAFVLALLALDLGVFHRKAESVSFHEAVGWSVVWITLALGFNFVLYRYALWKFPLDPRLAALPGFDSGEAARQVGLEFLTGYLIEKALSVDNIFIFIVVFGYFGIPAAYRHRVLFYGILGALVFRAAFIAVGATLMAYHWVLYVFGGFLVLTGIKMFFAGDEKIEPRRNPAIRLLGRFVPITSELHDKAFFRRVNGVLHATPLFAALVFLETTDVIFAVDSVPAIFAVTDEPLIVFTSNIFAVLGLRSLFFLLAGVADRFHMLKYGLAAILIFVGLKMVWLNDFLGGKFPVALSLGIIAGLLGLSVAASLLFPKRHSPRPVRRPRG